MFIILSFYRTGTHLLGSLLSSHPEITCYGEIFARKNNVLFGKKDFDELEDNDGFILMYTHYLKYADKRARFREQKVIHLTRENLTNQAKSMLERQERLSTDRLIKKQVRSIKNYKRVVFRDKFTNMYEITYEQICGDRSVSEYRNDNLLKFLGVRPMKLTTGFVKGVDPQLECQKNGQPIYQC